MFHTSSQRQFVDISDPTFEKKFWLGTVVLSSNPNIHEVEIGRSEIQGHLPLASDSGTAWAT